MYSRRFLFALVMARTIGFVGPNLYLPSLPDIVEKLNTTPFLVQLTIPCYMIAFGLSHLVYGPLSDRFGRRKQILFGLLFSLIGTAVCATAPDIYQLMLGRFLQGLGLGAGSALARPIIRDISSGDLFSHYSSILSVSSSVFMAAAPTLGGYLQLYFGWQSSFIFLFAYTILTFGITLLFLPETNTDPNLKALKPRYFFDLRLAHL